jgi:hypothetical protein
MVSTPFPTTGVVTTLLFAVNGGCQHRLPLLASRQTTCFPPRPVIA